MTHTKLFYLLPSLAVLSVSASYYSYIVLTLHVPIVWMPLRERRWVGHPDSLYFFQVKKTFFHLGLLFYNSFRVFRLRLNSLILSLCNIFLPGKKPSVILAFSFIILSNSLDFIIFGWIFQPLFMG